MGTVRTGIEIQVGLSAGQRTVGQVLSALHLESLGDALKSATTAVIRVDGQEIQEPLYEAHFVEAAPGPHTVEMWVKGAVGSPAFVQQAVFGRSTEVWVEHGEVTVLRYTPHEGLGAKLEILQSRAAATS